LAGAPKKSREEARVAKNWGPVAFRRLLIAAAGLFLGAMTMDRFDPILAYRLVPGPELFFAQMTGLFPNANKHIMDYRAEAWLCREQRFEEADETPFFPVLAGTKESRFHRTLYFYYNHRPTLRALDAYLTDKFSGSPQFAGEKIGGVRFSKVDEPIPSPGDPVLHFSRKLLSLYPESAVRFLYYTPQSLRDERCAGVVP
jgi:hypothetical protein